MKAVVALAFGVPAELRSNKCVAEVASLQSEALGGAPIFTQLGMEMHYGLPTKPIEGEHPGHWANTMQMATAAVAWAKKEGICELWIAAATPHLRRTLRDFQDEVRRQDVTIELRECPQHMEFSSADWFCADSEQSRTRTRLVWYAWDIPLMLMPLSLYRRLTDFPL